MSETKSTGEAMVGALVREGVDTVFGIPGAQTYELFDALGRASDQIRVLAPRHEQAASYMAFGYARSTGRTGVYSVVPGPGVLNSSAGLCTAYGASAPVVCLTSEVPSPYIGVGLGHLHELPDQDEPLHELPLHELPDHEDPLHELPDQLEPLQLEPLQLEPLHELPDQDEPFQLPPDQL